MALKNFLPLSLLAAASVQGAVTRATPPAACPSVYAIEAKGADQQTYYFGVISQFRGVQGKGIAARTDFDQSFDFFQKGTEAHLKRNPELYINRNKCDNSNVLSYQANADKLDPASGGCDSTVTVIVNPITCAITLFDGANRYLYTDEYGSVILSSTPVKQNSTVNPLTNLRAIAPKDGPFPVEPPAPLPTSACPAVFEVELKGDNGQTYYARGADGAPYSLTVTPYAKAGIQVYINGTQLVYNDFRSYYLHTTTEDPGFQPYLVFVSDAEKAQTNQAFIPIQASVDTRPGKNCALTLKWGNYSTVYLKPQARRSSIRLLSIPGPQGPIGDNVKITNIKAILPAI